MSTDGRSLSGQPEHSPYTPEGQIEQYGAVARGLKRMNPRKRTVFLTVILVVFLAPWVVFLVAMLLAK